MLGYALTFILYFMIALVMDVLITVQTKLVFTRQYMASGVLSFLICFIGWVVCDQYIQDRSWLLIIGYSSGTMLGTVIGMRIGKKNDKQ